MPIFGKKAPETTADDPIAAFWGWWSAAKPTVQDAIEAKHLPPALIDEISRRVKAIHPALAWEVGPGRRSRYQLCVSAEGDTERRAITEWWRQAAPRDADWDYFPARQPTPDASALIIGPHAFDGKDLRFDTEVDLNRERIHLKVWHPLFPQVEERVRGQVTYLLLDALLGEDGVERWMGRIEPLAERPADSIDRDALVGQIEVLTRKATGGRFVLGQAPGRDGKVRVLAMNTALKHIDHLDKPFRFRLIIELKDSAPNGLPSQQESQALNELEDRVGSVLQDGVFAGRVTGGGQRILNWYVPDPLRAETAVSPAIRDRGWRIATRTDPDPRWEGLKRNLLD